MDAQPVGVETNGAKPTKWWKLPELAEEWRVSVRTVERLISPKAGKDRLPSALIGKSRRVRAEIAEAYWRARETR